MLFAPRQQQQHQPACQQTCPAEKSISRPSGGTAQLLLALHRAAGNQALGALLLEHSQPPHAAPAIALKPASSQASGAAQHRSSPTRAADAREREADDAAARALGTPRASARELEASAPPATLPPRAHLSGQPLSAEARAFMEPRFGYDFSRVRVHTGPDAERSARQLNAAAYTVGSDIVFGGGHYAPETAAGRELLAHELAHTVQQSQAQRPALQRRELEASVMSMMTHTIDPQDWYLYDREDWQEASAMGNISSLSNSNTFIRAAYYNTQNLRPAEYQTIEQRHNYYDLISYAIEYDPHTPAAARDVRFFHATTLVTGSPGIGTADMIGGLFVLKPGSRAILREVNAELFALNMAVIRNLLLNWQELRAPAYPTGAISAFDFDIQMVEYEQSHVETYIQANRQRFTSEVVSDINETLDPSPTKQFFNPTRQALRWAMQALGGVSLDFTELHHRLAIGIAEVHIFHRKSLQDYLTYMGARNIARGMMKRFMPFGH